MGSGKERRGPAWHGRSETIAPFLIGLDMTQKKLFTVTIETEIVVVASDNDEAEKVAKEAFRSRDIGSEEYDFRPREMKFLPSGWDLNAIPFGEREASDPDRTIQGWIDAGAGVFYLEERERLRKVRESFRESLRTKKEGVDPMS